MWNFLMILAKFLISTFSCVCELSLLMFYYLRLLNELLTFVGRNKRGSSWSLFEVQAHTNIGIKKAKTFTNNKGEKKKDTAKQTRIL